MKKPVTRWREFCSGKSAECIRWESSLRKIHETVMRMKAVACELPDGVIGIEEEELIRSWWDWKK